MLDCAFGWIFLVVGAGIFEIAEKVRGFVVSNSKSPAMLPLMDLFDRFLETSPLEFPEVLWTCNWNGIVSSNFSFGTYFFLFLSYLNILLGFPGICIALYLS